jgi:hypothetical protein
VSRAVDRRVRVICGGRCCVASTEPPTAGGSIAGQEDNVEIGEAITVGVEDVENLGAPSCKHNERKPAEKWKARVNKKGGGCMGQDKTKCSGTNLYDEGGTGIWARRSEHASKKQLGAVPEKKSNDHWAQNGLAAVTPESFPVQAHHLIPKNFLPTHEVCAFLCKDYGDPDGRYELIENAPYNTDHANNGYCMPDALRLKEWKAAKGDPEERLTVAFRVMELTRVQLHQGSHAADLEFERLKDLLPHGSSLPPAKPRGGDSDDLEDEEIHPPGYTNALNELLNAVYSRVKKHLESCSVCKPDKKKPQIAPLQDTQRLLNRVSYIAKVFLQHHIICACPYGAAYAMVKSLLVWDGKNAYIMRSGPRGALDLTKRDLVLALSKRKG